MSRPITANQRSAEGSMGYEAPLNSIVASVRPPGGQRSRAKRKPPCRGWLAEKSNIGGGAGVGAGVGSGVGTGVAVAGCGAAVLVAGAVVGEGAAASLPPQATAAARTVSSQRARRGRTDSMLSQTENGRRA